VGVVGETLEVAAREGLVFAQEVALKIASGEFGALPGEV